MSFFWKTILTWRIALNRKQERTDMAFTQGLACAELETRHASRPDHRPGGEDSTVPRSRAGVWHARVLLPRLLIGTRAPSACCNRHSSHREDAQVKVAPVSALTVQEAWAATTQGAVTRTPARCHGDCGRLAERHSAGAAGAARGERSRCSRGRAGACRAGLASGPLSRRSWPEPGCCVRRLYVRQVRCEGH